MHQRVSIRKKTEKRDYTRWLSYLLIMFFIVFCFGLVLNWDDDINWIALNIAESTRKQDSDVFNTHSKIFPRPTGSKVNPYIAFTHTKEYTHNRRHNSHHFNVSLPLTMLFNIGVRSAGTSEFMSLVQNWFGWKSICLDTRELVVENVSSVEQIVMSCEEHHYWDSIECVSCSLIDHDQDDNYTFQVSINKDNRHKCDVVDFYKKAYSMYDEKKKNKDISTLAQRLGKNIGQFEDLIYYDKSPRYYLYSHIAVIFANEPLFIKMKIFVLLRDPIKSSISTFYDLGCCKTTYQSWFKQHVLNHPVLNSIRMNMLNKYLPKIKLTQNTGENININYKYRYVKNIDAKKLKFLYELVDYKYKKWMYYDARNMNAQELRSGYQRLKKEFNPNGDDFNFLDVSTGSAVGMRNCHIVPFLQWFKQFGFYDLFFKLLKLNINNNDNANDLESFIHQTFKSNIVNRLRFVQSEYFFEHMEDIANELYCWSLGYNPHKKCEKTSFVASNSGEYDWIKLDITTLGEEHSRSHSIKAKQNSIDQRYQRMLAKFYQPCTTHMIHFLQKMQMMQTKYLERMKNGWMYYLLIGTFDPKLWSVATSPMFDRL